ncbi:MAG: hypothetical protein JNL80_18210 [Phycisphaerae bacterium]|nr:hypothetical protein [Phycisphaerae bacterium]
MPLGGTPTDLAASCRNVRAVVINSVRFVVLAVVAVAVVGCAAPTGPLARPVVLGASVSSGERSALVGRMRPGEGESIPNDASLEPVGLAKAIDACIASTHGETKSFAESSMAFHPAESLARQVRLAKAVQPTAVFAIDALFWAAYGPAASSAERAARLKSCCESLGSIEAPIVVGNLPDMRGAVARLLGDAAAPSEVDRSALNRQIAEWAGHHPNVLVLSLEQLVEDIRRGETVNIGVAELTARESGRLFASDGLHLTSDGELAIATLSLSAFIAVGAVPQEAVFSDLRLSRQFLERRRESDRRPLTTASVSVSRSDRQRRALERSIESDRAMRAGDVELAARLTAERFSPEEADIRAHADVLECELALVRTPDVAIALRKELEARVSAGQVADLSTAHLDSTIELGLMLKEPTMVQPAIIELARRASADRATGSAGEVPSALGYAHRLYEWFVAEQPVAVVALFPDADATARELAEKRRADLAKLAFAKGSGFSVGKAHVRTPREEIIRFAESLRAAGRPEEAGRVASLVSVEPDG